MLPELAEKSLQALKWNYLGTAGRVLLQLVAQIALARLLGPEAFGSFATVLLVMGLGSLIAEAGLSSSLIREKEISTSTIRFTFTRLIIIGGAVALSICALAGTLADLFESRRIVPMVYAMTPGLLFQTMGTLSLAILRRDLQYRFIQFAQLAAYSIGFVLIGIPCALAGLGAWSLIIAWNAQCAIASVLLYGKTRHPIRPLLTFNDNGLVKYGMTILGTNIANWIAENLDNLIVAKQFGSKSIGLYSVSYNLVRSPTNHLVASLQQVLFPASAQASREGSDVGRAYLVVLSVVAAVSLPIFVSVSVLSETTILTLYGASWLDAAEILIPLALAMPFHAMMAIGGPVLWGLGRAELELKVQIWIACILLIVLLVTSRYSAAAVAWGVLGVYAMRALWLTWLLAELVKIGLGQLFAAIQGAVLLAVVNAATLSALSVWLASYHIAPPLSLTLCGVVALALDCAVVIAYSKFFLTEDLRLVLNRVIGRFMLRGRDVGMGA